jgi:hypothetical protein
MLKQKERKMKHKQIKLFAVIAIVLTQMVFGQITFETKMTSDGFMGMGAFKSTTKTYLIEDAQKTETKLKFTGAIMKMFSPKGTTSNIIRLDKELIWAFDDRKKRYTEQTFDEIRKTFEEFGQAGYAQQMSQGSSPEEDYEVEYEWSKPVVNVKNLKETKTINGFNCLHYLASVTTVGTHLETGIKDTMLFVSDMWNAKDVSKKMELVYDFNKRYMDAIGFDVPENQGLAMITGMYKEQMQTLTDEVSKLQGYAIINDMKLTMTKNLLSVKQDEEVEEPEEESISLRDIKKNFGGLLGKKIMKDVVDKKAEKKTKELQNISVSELFHMKTEVLSINEGSLAGEVFEVKKGYKLKKN